jgi:hypothetical protein
VKIRLSPTNDKIKAILHIFDHTIKPILLYGSEIWGSFPATKLLTEGDNYFSNVCRDLIAEKGDFKLCKDIEMVTSRYTYFLQFSIGVLLI